MSRPLRLGFVGCGDIAGYTAWFARLNRGIRLAACCDLSSEKAGNFAKRFRIPEAYTSYQGMLTQAEMDAVYLAVPHHLHAEMIADALGAGLHVLVEKPITRTLAEGKAVAGLALDSSLCLGVNYQYRYDTGCYALARAVQRGELGQIHYARCHIPWRRAESYFQQAPWHARLAEAGGGTLIIQGSHFLDILLWALPGRPQTTMGYTAQRRFQQVEVEDLAQGIVAMDDGALIQISSAMVSNPEQAVTIEVFGEKGSAHYINRPRPRVRFSGVRPGKTRPPVRGIHALQRCLEGFRAWVVEGKPFLVPAEESLAALAAVEAIYRSAYSGRREQVADWQPHPDSSLAAPSSA